MRRGRDGTKAANGPGERPVPSGRVRFRSIPLKLLMLVLVASVGVALAVFVLLFLLASAQPEASRTQLQFDAVKTASTSGILFGGAITLFLAARRQWLSEHAQTVSEEVAEHNMIDLIERRTADLYIKAAEQLGHAQPAVRLAGLYALEQLGQAYPENRRKVVDVICGYLRMPFVLPNRSHLPWIVGVEDVKRKVEKEAEPDPGEDLELSKELQVRVTAQTILFHHLRHEINIGISGEWEENREYWPGMKLNLRGAVLVGFMFSHCHLLEADFRSVTFFGPTSLDRSTIDAPSAFAGACFKGNVNFGGTTFGQFAGFHDVKFDGGVDFDFAAFRGQADFRGAVFKKAASFYCAKFERGAPFPEANFTGADFHDVVKFSSAEFHVPFYFQDTVFRQGVDLKYAKVARSSRKNLDDIFLPPGWKLRDYGADISGELISIHDANAQPGWGSLRSEPKGQD
jgi:hypothetical protein